MLGGQCGACKVERNAKRDNTKRLAEGENQREAFAAHVMLSLNTKFVRCLAVPFACLSLVPLPSYASDWVEDEDILPVQQMQQLVPSAPVITQDDEPKQFDVDKGMNSAISPALTMSQELTALELSLLDEAFGADGILRRIERLEESAQLPSNGNILERMRRLREQISTSDQNVKDAQQAKVNTFLNPPDVPWLNGIGRGARAAGRGVINLGRSVDNAASSVLSSPEFWGLAIGLGAGIPLAMMANRSAECKHGYGFGNPKFLALLCKS